nr:S-adenosylmethionine carrier 1, chloroplastic/mitochondrial-like [Arachis hypogaea]
MADGCIAGGVAGVIVETALYPIDTIKTRLQVTRGGGQIILKGLYSGLAGNLAGVLSASAIFVGVYEPIKQKLLRSFPENLSAIAHFMVALLEVTREQSICYHPIPIVFSQAKGVAVWDPEGNKYLDFLSAYSAANQLFVVKVEGESFG